MASENFVRIWHRILNRRLQSPLPAYGETVGFYVPARRKREQADLEALRKAGEQLDAMIAAAGTTEDELLEDFKKARRNRVRKH